MKYALVTCGATVPFPDLVIAILDKIVLQELQTTWSIEVLILQYGNDFDNEFTDILQRVTDSKPLKGDTDSTKYGAPYMISASVALNHNKSINIIGIPYSTDIDNLLDISSIVIAHAGTGSILDARNHGVPLITVPNEHLADNHQIQIAERLHQSGVLIAARATSKSISEAIISLKSLPTDPSNINDDDNNSGRINSERHDINSRFAQYLANILEM